MRLFLRLYLKNTTVYMEQIIGKCEGSEKHREFLYREFNEPTVVINKNIHDIGTGKSLEAAENFNDFTDEEIENLLLIDNCGKFYEKLMPNYDAFVNHPKLKPKLSQMRNKIRLLSEEL